MNDKITILIILRVGDNFSMINFKQEFDINEIIHSENNCVQIVDLIQSQLNQLENQVSIGDDNYRFIITMWMNDDFHKEFNQLDFTINSFDKTIQKFVERKIVNSEIQNIF